MLELGSEDESVRILASVFGTGRTLKNITSGETHYIAKFVFFGKS